MEASEKVRDMKRARRLKVLNSLSFITRLLVLVQHIDRSCTKEEGASLNLNCIKLIPSITLWSYCSQPQQPADNKLHGSDVGQVKQFLYKRTWCLQSWTKNQMVLLHDNNPNSVKYVKKVSHRKVH